ncbi:MAG: L-serine ammonia-lyase [Burkholderiales bacterium]|nr:L-serine ammonia-lyase [Burkholderiales bacterium]
MLGALDMFAIGIGPSSSHTIGPMRAAYRFVQLLKDKQLLDRVVRLEVNLYGSLALTGEGHGTVIACLNGLCGEQPETVNIDNFLPQAELIKCNGEINLCGQHKIAFNFCDDMHLHKKEFLPEHANGMRFIAYDINLEVLISQEYFSIGGGFVLDKEQMLNISEKTPDNVVVPYPFETAYELFSLCEKHNLTVAQLVTQNELGRKTLEQVRHEALEIIRVMRLSVARGISVEGLLPGGLTVKRRAPGLYKKLNVPNIQESLHDQRLLAMAFAIGVNEENAAFGRVVTAPTNGSAGTIPGVLEYYVRYGALVTDDKLIEFILTAGAIGMLYKMRASISAAEVGCQGEIGVACSMAAAALTAVMGGSLIQIAKAAEIAMEHSLGMTCDPIGGLVQIPCIERNGVAASRAIDIARLALLEEEAGRVSLDEVIKTMMQTGKDMGMRYKETALGGLAVNVVNC